MNEYSRTGASSNCKNASSAFAQREVDRRERPSFRFASVAMVGLLLFSFLPAQANARAMDCTDPDNSLVPWFEVFDDASTELSVEDVAGLPGTEWQPASSRSLAPGRTRSAIWLQLHLKNPTAESCHRNLFLGSPKVRNVQLYQWLEDGWSRSVGGGHYPFHDWATQARPYAFPVSLEAGEERRVLIRLASEMPIAVQPFLLSDLEMLRVRMAEGVADGLVIGVVLLLVIFSISLGWIYRSSLLIVHALSVLSYVVFVILANAYGLNYLWPNQPELDTRLTLAASIVTRMLVLEYIAILLLVRLLPGSGRGLLYFCRACLGVLLVCTLFFPQLSWLKYGGPLYWFVGPANLAIYLAWLLAGHRRKLPYNWLCYLVPSLILLQSLLEYAFLLGWATRSPFEYSWLSISTLPGAFLLTATLISQVAQSRRAEKQALSDIERLRETERERLESMVALRTQQVMTSLRALKMLLARISHDLRTPLQHVMAEIAKLRGLGREQSGQVRDIQSSMRYQLELIEDLLEYSTEEVKHMELLVAPGYLPGFLEMTAEQGRFLARRNHNRFLFEMSGALPPRVEADFKRLRQVLVNLLANAAKYTTGGEIRFRVELLNQRDSRNLLRFIVRDNGIGTPQQQLGVLQEPFRRADAALGREGKGLGLFIVRDLLQLMGSELKLDSPPGGGSCFYFELALDSVTEDEMELVYIEDHAVDWNGEGYSILIADPSDASRVQLTELLSGYGCDVECCSDPERALSRICSQHFDLVISDHTLPKMDGLRLLEVVREQGIHTPFLLYESTFVNPDEEHGDSCAYHARLRKPAPASQLLKVIRELIEAEASCEWSPQMEKTWAS